MSEILSTLESRKANSKYESFKLDEAKFVSADDDSFLEIGHDQWQLTDSSFGQLCNVVEVPKLYAKRCDSEFLATTMNHWLTAASGINYGALVEEDKIRSFIDPKYTYVPTLDVVNTVLGAAGNTFRVENGHVQDDVTELVIMTDELTQEVLGSEVRGGIRVVYSDSWNVFPKFDTYLYRLICSNGMMAPLSHTKFRVSGKSSKEILTNIDKYASNSLERLNDMLDGFVHLQEQKIDKTNTTIKRICNENKLPKKVSRILIDWSEKPEFLATIRNSRISDMHDLVNLFTYVGSHNFALTDEVRERLMTIGGHAALYNTTRCTSCGGVVG